jgi:hypothetical protein
MGLYRFEDVLGHANAALENSLMIYEEEHSTQSAIRTTIELIYTRQWEWKNRRE